MAIKPPAKPAAAPAKEEAAAAPAPKSKKGLIIVVALLMLGIGIGAGWFFSRGNAPAGEHGAAAEVKKPETAQEPKFIMLGENFTVNLQREEGDQYLQAGITLKIMQPELEEQIKKTMPEIRSKLLFLLSSKLPSELQTAEGKRKLVAEIIAEVDGVLGIAPEAAPPAGEQGASAPVPATPKTTGVVDVLFTSFIIQ